MPRKGKAGDQKRIPVGRYREACTWSFYCTRCRLKISVIFNDLEQKRTRYSRYLVAERSRTNARVRSDFDAHCDLPVTSHRFRRCPPVHVRSTGQRDPTGKSRCFTDVFGLVVRHSSRSVCTAAFVGSEIALGHKSGAAAALDVV